MTKNDKHQQIIGAALEVFREKGYANTRMADIAKRAGVSYGLVYHYFGSKEVLFDVIVNGWWEDISGMLEAEGARNGVPVIEKLENIIRFLLDRYENNPDLVSIFVTEVSRSSSYRTEKGLEQFNQYFRLTENIMAAAQKNCELRDDVPPHYLTYIFLGSLEAFISVMVLGKENLTSERAERTVSSLLQVFMSGAESR